MTNSQSHPRVFIVWSDEIEGILSPLFFISKPVSKKGLIKLKEVALVNPTRKKPVFGDDTIAPYVGLPETNDQQIREIWMRPYKSVRGRNVIRKGDILFARIEPSVFNKKYILVDDLKGHDFAFTSTEFYIVEPKENINPLFLFYMFFVQPVYDQVIGKTTGSTGRRRLDKGVFENILIPHPTRAVQDTIVAHLQSAYGEKRKKEEEIKKILASIDGFVLGELGIDMPEEGTQQVFQIWSDEIQTRLDPIYLRDYSVYSNLKSKYHSVRLADILSEPPQYGANERAVTGDLTQDVRYIRITDVDDRGELKTDDWKTAEKIEDKYILQENDLLFARSGATAGKTYLYKSDAGKAIFAGYMIRFKIDQEKANPDYIFYLTKTRYYELWKNLIQRPAGQPNINSEEFKSFKLPLPPISVQKKIVDNVQLSYSKMRTLRAQVSEVLTVAQKQVEQMILA